MNFSCGCSRREFLTHTSCFGVFYALAMRIPLPALAAELTDNARISQTPLVDKGFAAVRKIGNGLYASVSDYSGLPRSARCLTILPAKHRRPLLNRGV
jgi:hypothetical protein